MRSVLAIPVAFFGGAGLACATSCAANDDACNSAFGEEASMLQLKSQGVTAGLIAAAPVSGRPVQNKPASSKPFMGSRELGGTAETGKIKINEDGIINEYWLPGATTEDDYTSVKYLPPYRFYLMKTYTTDYSKAENFYFPPLVGKTFSVDINYGGPNGPGCGCNLNFYLVDMPADSPGSSGDYYCDAQCFPDMGCCAEFDMNEGNMMVEQITNHACTNDYASHPDWVCNKWGDPEQKTTQAELSPGSATIDTTKPFTYEQEYREVNGDAKVITRMKQEGRVLEKTMGPGNSQLNSMFKVIGAGMAFVTGYWFDASMNWLDSDECGASPETCDNAPAWISNWKITTNSAVNPTEAPVTNGPTATPVGPTEAPAGGGKCCWNGCDTCEMSAWCMASEDQCSKCGGGTWCT